MIAPVVQAAAVAASPPSSYALVTLESEVVVGVTKPPTSIPRWPGCAPSGNRDVTVRLIPGVSHSLLYDPVGLASGWVYLPGFMTALEVRNGASDWLADRLRPRHAGT